MGCYLHDICLVCKCIVNVQFHPVWLSPFLKKMCWGRENVYTRRRECTKKKTSTGNNNQLVYSYKWLACLTLLQRNSIDHEHHICCDHELQVDWLYQQLYYCTVDKYIVSLSCLQVPHLFPIILIFTWWSSGHALLCSHWQHCWQKAQEVSCNYIYMLKLNKAQKDNLQWIFWTKMYHMIWC